MTKHAKIVMAVFIFLLFVCFATGVLIKLGYIDITRMGDMLYGAGGRIRQVLGIKKKNAKPGEPLWVTEPGYH